MQEIGLVFWVRDKDFPTKALQELHHPFLALSGIIGDVHGRDPSACLGLLYHDREKLGEEILENGGNFGHVAEVQCNRVFVTQLQGCGVSVRIPPLTIQSLPRSAGMRGLQRHQEDEPVNPPDVF